MVCLKKCLAISLVATVFFEPAVISAEVGKAREVQIRPLTKKLPVPVNIVPAAPPKSKPMELEHHLKQKAFLEELRLEADQFQKKLQKVSDPAEARKMSEEFRETRREKISAFLAGSEKSAAGGSQS